jgi:hypothetical protein
MTDFNTSFITGFKFGELFNELGWDSPAQKTPYTVTVGEQDFKLEIVADKRSVQILRCCSSAGEVIPNYSTRQKIERKITAEVREHLIVFTDYEQTTQVWQWVSREHGRPNQYREITWHKSTDTELLRQKLRTIAFTLTEEESLSVLGVTRKLSAGFDRDKVTKKFYTEFEKQRKAFAAFIEGIPLIGKEIADDQRWYCAVIIDRLMFLWFLQEKLFLNGRKDYLESRLVAHRDQTSGGQPSFYRSFLCPLFFSGFAEARTDANSAEIKAKFGDVPYLNGGLFAQHKLEHKYGNVLDVADTAFEKLFAFFNQWDWHLDDRPQASGREINPDVLGYIFEKFVNQKQMGAYYTKEDITEYIGKNTILPCLLTKVRTEHAATFDALAWPLLQHSGDRYIYPAMLVGVDTTYPQEIANGLDAEAPDLLARRKPWNKRAETTISLSTEIWRETIARHDRTREVREKISAGAIREISDLITYNLNIRQFVQDLIESCTDIGLLKSFWFNLAGRLPRKSNEKFRRGLSVLDPTCGSGAFLFAALNILKPLYDATLRTLHAVRGDTLIAGEQSAPEKWAEVDEILTRFGTAKTDREQSYAVIKHIIVNNLYGVDIEEQATEIAKLRLFLKLVSLLEPNDNIEPLPDIDFNIRHGNTLVGYATADETRRAVEGVTQGNLFNDAWEDIRIRLVAVEEQYNNFQIQQVQRGGYVSAADKQSLDHTLSELEETLNYHLAKEYGVERNIIAKYEAWKASHQPFHWFVDFYPLIANGGFDAVVGNPPWKEYAAVKATYAVMNYETIAAGNLYGLCTERMYQICSDSAFVSFIVQLPLVSSSRMGGLRSFIKTHSKGLWVATFDDRPGKLFEGLQNCRSAVFVSQNGKGKNQVVQCSRYLRWPTITRPDLFAGIKYLSHTVGSDLADSWFKSDDSAVASAITKIMAGGYYPIARYRMPSRTDNFVYYQESARYWVKASAHLPYYSKDSVASAPSHGRWVYFDNAKAAMVAAGLLNSSLFYTYFVTFGDCFHVTDGLVSAFPLPEACLMDESLLQLSSQLMQELKLGATRKVISSKSGSDVERIEYDEYKASDHKEIIDLIDLRLALHFGLSPEESASICSFDQKFRNGEDDNDD